MVISLRYFLYAQSSYVQGGPVIIGFSIENLSSNDLWILKWYTPLEGIKGKIFEVKCDGVDIPYEGRLMKRGQPERDDYVCIYARDSAHTEFDLSSAYTLPVCQECHLKFKGQIHDVVLEQQQLPRPSDEQFLVDVPGDSISFRITHE